MSVVINGDFLCRNLTGIERFAYETCIRLDKIIEKDSIEIYVPSNAVFHPYIPTRDVSPSPIAIFKGNTNGLASGNIIEESVLHGIFEVVERDAWSIFELTKRNKKEIRQDNIDNEIINELLGKFNSQGIDIKLMDITADLKITTIAASVVIVVITVLVRVSLFDLSTASASESFVP